MCLKCLISSLFSRMCMRAVCHFIKKERNKCTRGKGKKTQHNRIERFKDRIGGDCK